MLVTFPTMFSKGFFLRVVKSQDCVVELTLSNTSPDFHMSAVQVFRKHCGKMAESYPNG